MTDNIITIFLADDHQILIDGIMALVAKDPELKVIGTCNGGLQVLARVEAAKPDVLVLDISIPGVNGLDLCRLVKARIPDMKIIMLTMHSNRRCVLAALENGASGYLIKEVASSEFCQAVRAVARGEIYLGQGIPKSILDEIDRKPADAYDTLTDRERRVIQLLVGGKSNQQIADALQTPLDTVDTDLANLMRKLNLHDQDELVKYAVRKCPVGIV